MKSPYKFLDSYTQEDGQIFFGREREVEELYSRVFQSKILIVYGASGTGKSSVINCGLANKFESSDWLPVQIRRGRNINESLIDQILRTNITPIRSSGRKSSADFIAAALESTYLDHFKPIYLIFDQFEELFIMGEKDELDQFIKTVSHLLKMELQIHFTFIIRGEYLEYLSEFEDRIPEFFDNRIRIEKMSRKNAREIIEGPAKVSGIKLEADFSANLLRKISPDSTQIELTFLQIYLDRIFRESGKKAGENLTFNNDQIEVLGMVGDVLSDFLEEQLKEMTNSEATLSLLKSFVSLEGTKTQSSLRESIGFTESIGEPVSESDAIKIIRELVARRILKEKDESGRYELRHDSLAGKIFEKITLQERELLDVRNFLLNSFKEYEKRDFLLDDEDLDYIDRHLSKLSLSNEIMAFVEESRKNSTKKRRGRRRIIVIMSVIVILLITSAFGFINAEIQKDKAEQLAELAVKESNNAQEQKTLAEDQKRIAEANSIEAQNQASIAEEERSRAETLFRQASQAQEEAERQRALAVRNESIAKRNASVADQNATTAQNQKRLADEQREIALEEKQKADDLRMLAIARSIAIKSDQVMESDLKILLASQSYYYNSTHNGSPFNSDVYSAVYESNKLVLGNDFNEGIIPSGSIRDLSRSNTSYYTTGSDGEVYKWDLNLTQPAANPLFNTGFINHCLSVDLDDKTLAIGTDEGHLILWGLLSNERLWMSDLHGTDITSITHGPHDTLISGDKNGNIFKWDLKGKGQKIISEKEKINQLIFDQANAEFYAAIESGEVIRFDLMGNKSSVLKAESPASSICLDKQTLLVGYGSGEVVLFDLEKSSVTTNLLGHSSRITDCSINDKFVLTASMDQSARLWSKDRLKEQPIQLNDLGSWLTVASIDPDNRYFIAGSFDGRLRSYEIEMRNYADNLCPSVNRSLTNKEWDEYLGEEIRYEPACK